MTKDEINRALGERVMEWHFDKVQWLDKDGNFQGYCWNPYERWDHAGMVAEKFYGYIIEKIGSTYRAKLLIDPRKEWFTGPNGATATIAICLAAIGVKEEHSNTYDNETSKAIWLGQEDKS